jgi:hypothetical protein
VKDANGMVSLAIAPYNLSGVDKKELAGGKHGKAGESGEHG